MKYRTAWLAAGWLLIFLIAWLSLMPSPPTPLRFPHVDKLEHLIAYAALMGWFAQLYHTNRERVILAMAFIALGAGIELLQGWGGHRSAEWTDLLADSLGITLGLLLGTTSAQFLLTRFDARLASHHECNH